MVCQMIVVLVASSVAAIGTWHPVHAVPLKSDIRAEFVGSELLIEPPFGPGVDESGDPNWSRNFALPTENWVGAACQYEGQLYVGGDFQRIGGVAVGSMARWDGVEWEAVGGVGGTVNALEVHGDDLVVGGSFSQVGGIQTENIARYDGATWHQLGDGLQGCVTSLCALGEFLYAAGGFCFESPVVSCGVARWDGVSWTPVSSENGMNSYVEALTVFDGHLVAGGSFTEVDGQAISGVARWDGAGWHPLGDGLEPAVLALTVFQGHLLAGGLFDEPVPNLAQWDGSEWIPFSPSPDSRVCSLYALQDELYAGGRFQSIGGVVANYIAVCRDGSWQALGEGTSEGVMTISGYGTGVLIGGDFALAGGLHADKTAYWNGQRWRAIRSTAGCSGDVLALAVHEDGVVAGGTFEQVGGKEAARVALWDGISWEALGEGLDGAVRALTSWDGTIVAAGEFLTSGQAGCNRIASWDGESWTGLGSGFSDAPLTLCQMNGTLYAGGRFTSSGGAPIDHVAVWMDRPTGQDTESSSPAPSVSLAARPQSRSANPPAHSACDILPKTRRAPPLHITRPLSLGPRLRNSHHRANPSAIPHSVDPLPASRTHIADLQFGTIRPALRAISLLAKAPNPQYPVADAMPDVHRPGASSTGRSRPARVYEDES